MFCPKCGSKNDENAAFCGSCGNKLNAPQAAEAAKEAPVVKTTATGSVTTGDGTTAKAAKRTGTIIGIAVAVVIIVVMAATCLTGVFGLAGSNSGENGLTGSSESFVKNSVNDYTWDELSRISTEISKASDEDSAIEIAKGYNLTTEDGKLDGSQAKSIQLSNGTNIDVQITGFWHDDKIGGGKAGITFIFKDAIAENAMNSTNTNAGGWKGSQLRSWLASDGVNMLPDDLKSALVEVEKKTNNVGLTGSTSSVSTTAEKIWLYSVAELCGQIHWWGASASYYNDIVFAEGTEYQLFRDLRVNSGESNEILVKWFVREPCSWWTRTPDPYDVLSGYYGLAPQLTPSFCGVSSTGEPHYFDNSDDPRGVVPGFCI